MASAELTVITEQGEKTYELREGAPLFVGRTAECDICLPSPAVSRRHAAFLVRGESCGIKDLASSNGTYLNGQRLTKPVRLKDGDTIQIANFVIRFQLIRAERYEEAARTVLLSRDALDAEGLSFSPDDGNAVPPREPAPAPHADGDDRRSDSPPSADAMEAGSFDTPAGIADDAAASEITASAERDDDDTPEKADAAEEAGKPGGEAMATGGDEDAGASDPAPGKRSDTTSVVPIADPVEETPPVSPKEAKKRSESIRKIPKAPHAALQRAEIDEDEVGDGSGDDQFLADGEEPEEEDKELALAKAAAEAGLVGEFTPEEGDAHAGDAGGNGSANGGSGKATGREAHGAAAHADHPKAAPDAPAPALQDIPIDDAFREAIEARLFLYSFLTDMKREREAMLAEHPDLPDAVQSELGRQDREMDKLLTAEQAEGMIEKRLARRADLKAKIKEAKAAGTPPPPRPSREMREAEDIAINQWTIMAQSHREALPAVFTEGYRINGKEPLAGVLEEAGIDGVALMGGGAYLIALGALLEETKNNRAYIKTRMAEMTAPEEKKHGGGKRLFGLFSKKGGAHDEMEEAAAPEGESYESLAETDAQLALRTAWITSEMAYIEAFLIKEFWVVYVKVALAFLPRHEEMPLSVRVFLRYGAIGFMPWWMKEDVRVHITEDCANDVIHHVQASRNTTAILYADEYLAAVMNMECTPAMDENLEINERNSPNWKADKALRKLINARSQSALMEELIEDLEKRIAGQEEAMAALDARIAALLPGSKNFKKARSELSQQRQSHKIEATKLANLVKKIRGETLANFQETITETEARFASGELPKPTPEFLLTRECEAVRKIGRLLANLKERFLPIVLRENFTLGLDSVNDRLAINGEILDFERRDPAVFLENLIPSKKKANRVDLRISPYIVLVPSAGILAFSWNPRQKPEDGRLAIPTCFIRPRLRERQLTYLLSDFRWDTAKAAAGMDVMNSDTIVAAFMGVRWDWRKRSKEGREKGLIYSEQNDRTNWRRVYEAYMSSASDGGKKLFNRNYDFYERIIGKYFDMPEGVTLLRK